MAYKCCNCDNTLEPQGPVQGLVTYQGSERKLDDLPDSKGLAITVNRSGDLLHLDSLKNLFSLFPGVKEIKFPLSGSLKNFELSMYKHEKVVIHCYNCGRTCAYHG